MSTSFRSYVIRFMHMTASEREAQCRQEGCRNFAVWGMVRDDGVPFPLEVTPLCDEHFHSRVAWHLVEEEARG